VGAPSSGHRAYGCISRPHGAAYHKVTAFKRAAAPVAHINLQYSMFLSYYQNIIAGNGSAFLTDVSSHPMTDQAQTCGVEDLLEFLTNQRGMVPLVEFITYRISSSSSLSLSILPCAVRKQVDYSTPLDSRPRSDSSPAEIVILCVPTLVCGH
jgi:hypothetical protein